MADAYRDGNDVPTLIASSLVDGKTPIRLYANPVTHRLLVDAGGGGTGITSINGDTTAAQLLVVGTAGTDFNIDDDNSGTHTFNLPSASATARGVVTTGTQTFAGNKTFTGAITASNLSGTNTGNQNLFSTIAVATQTSVTANTTTTTLTLVAGTNMTITTDNTTKTITFDASGGGGGGNVSGPGSSTDNAIVRWNGVAGTDIQNSAVIIDDTDNVTGMTTLTLPNTGLHLLDTNATHDLIIIPGSNLTADRNFTIVTGDAARTLSMAGNIVVSADLSTSGGDVITLTTTGATNVTLPITGTLATLAGVETLSNKTLTEPKFINGGFIADANGNEELIFITTASAVNEITLTNAATNASPITNAPLIAASGGDTNIGLKLHGKGTGKILLGTANLQWPNADGSANQTLITNGSGVLSFASTPVLNYGDGSDGNVTISSPTTLTRNMYYNNLTVSNILTTGGFMIFVNGTLTGSGTIKYPEVNSGQSVSETNTGGAGGSAFTGGYFVNNGGGDGGNGTTSNQFGGTGGSGDDGYIGSDGANGGGGGKVNDGNNGGAGGAAGSNLASFTPTILASLTLAGLEVSNSGSTVKYLVPGSGGGGGGNGIGTENSGGGGGGGGGGNGGAAVIVYGSKTWSGSYVLTGGTGGIGGNTTSGTSLHSGGGGGGGGASGGVILICVRTWAGTFTISVPGGDGGDGSNGDGGANASGGTNGSNGATGTAYEIGSNTLT